ncbi:tyrosine-protein phosphatase [Zhongshania guokunii]|uniref:Tyrosine-protein phosphatase n=1 Tax=Zhongshania guokunii TaxID=641783 RepID=A0ABV3U849_9GAMM
MNTQNSTQHTRRLPLNGAPNIRDLGGYQTDDGGTTRWQKLLRGGRLSNLSNSDQLILAQFDVRVVCDFRNPSEYQQDISKLNNMPKAVIHNLSISPGNHQNIIDISSIGADQMSAWMQQINREFVLNHSHTYRHMFELLLDNDDGAFLFHCSAGKDRTGFAAALVLSALNVSRETIMDDYLLTAQYYPPAGEMEYLAQKYTRNNPNIDMDLFATLTSTRPEFLQAAFTAIDEQYSSTDEYLEQALGLCAKKRELLKQRYVE